MATTRLGDLSNLILAGSDEIFNKAVQAPKVKYYENCSREVTQEKQTGNYDTVGDITEATEHTEESAVVFDKIEYNNRTTIVSKVYEKGVKATLEASEFDLYDVVSKQFGTPLVNALLTKKERIVADCYNHAFVNTGADGVAIISDSHPLKNNALLYNDNLVTGELGVESLKDGINKFNSIYNQAGQQFFTKPTHLLINPNKKFQAFELLHSQLMAFALINTKNVINEVAPLQIIENNYIDYTVSTAVSPWFLLDKALTDAGCILQKKKGLTLKTWFENADLSLKGIAYEIYGAGMVAPGYGIVGSTGA